MNEQLKGWMNLQTNLEEYALAEFPEDTIEGTIPANSIILLTGDPKAGKSFVAQSWAHSVATGADWLGKKVIPGGVAWVNPDGEHPKFLWERFAALDNYTGIKVKHGETLAAIETFKVGNEQACENLLAGVREGLKLVIIDTLAAAAGTSNLSNQNEFAPIADFAKEIVKAGENHGTSVIWIHHTTKNDDTGVSGSQQILAMASKHFAVKNQKGVISLIVKANRHSQAGELTSLAIEEVEIENGRNSAVIVSGDRSRKRTSPKLQTALEAIRKEGNYEPGEQIPKAIFAKELVALGIGLSTAYRALVAATEDGILMEHPSGKQMAYSFPVSQTFSNSEMGNTQDTFPPLPESLGSGIGKKGEVEEMETF